MPTAESTIDETQTLPQHAVVAIGRNEGERLRACLNSALRSPQCGGVVYVDSGSTDGSNQLASELGAKVLELDLATPFTAARARNAGLDLVRKEWPEIAYVQFVDGDCELEPAWVESATRVLEKERQIAAAAGRRRERFPEQTPYNRLCDIEWDTPIGEALACGGDVMMRIAALDDAGDYNPGVIAGEEPELCVRLRKKGWRILRVDAPMTIHDAAMSRLQQWWKRSVRAGHGFAEGYAMHGNPPIRHFAKELRSCLLWGALAPIVAIAAAPTTRGLSLAILIALYLALLCKVMLHSRAGGLTLSDALLYATNCLGAKFANATGAIYFFYNRARGRVTRIIEYK